QVTPAQDSGDTRYFDTEMLSLSLQGLGGNILFRESPTLPSLGKLRESPTLQSTGQTAYRIGSFFDVFTELSLDGGQTWTPANDPITVTLVPVTCAQIQCPPDQTVECGSDASPAATGTPTTTGSCSDVVVTHTDSASGDICHRVITRT